ncbi:MAG TPA: hypothetical protein VFQ53_16075 [Kofleriaceae bacterium]|nr:hypothetical protein [Kofleriaceae bacterium]
MGSDEHDVPLEATDIALDHLLGQLEAELRAHGQLSFATCEALRDNDDVRGLEGCLSFLRCTMFAVDPATPPLRRRRRIQACRLMLLSIGAHTDFPRWTHFGIEQMFEAALQIPGAELSDLVQALFALLAETKLACTRAQTNFIREIGAHVRAKRRLGHAADDFVWIAVRLTDPMFPVTEAQAFFATLVLPRRLRGSTREVLMRTLTSSHVIDELGDMLGDTVADDQSETLLE